MNPISKPTFACARIRRLTALTVLTLTLTLGCATPPLTYSGFLGPASDYALLKRQPDRIDASSWRDEKANFKRYHRVVIDTPEVYYGAAAGKRRLDADLRQKVVDEFKKMLVEALGAQYEVVDKPAPDALQIRTALTEIIPTGVIDSGLSAQDRVSISLEDAHMEAEVLDSMTAQQLVALVDSRRGRGLPLVQGQLRWDLVRTALRAWANELARQLAAQ